MKYSEKNLPIANISTANPRWEASNYRLRYGTDIDGLETQ
jgi:hypothetical protein